jgi:hypothetical protein
MVQKDGAFVLALPKEVHLKVEIREMSKGKSATSKELH